MNPGRFALLAALLIGAGAAQAHDFKVADLTILHPYATETSGRAMTGAGYLSIRNDGDAADALIAVRADFPRVTLHGSVETNGMMSMSEIERIEISPGETLELQSGGVHVMFMGLDGDPFETGERFPATLVFEQAGEIAVEFVVEPRAAETAGDAAPMDHSMHQAPDSK